MPCFLLHSPKKWKNKVEIAGQSQGLDANKVNPRNSQPPLIKGERCCSIVSMDLCIRPWRTLWKCVIILLDNPPSWWCVGSALPFDIIFLVRLQKCTEELSRPIRNDLGHFLGIFFQPLYRFVDDESVRRRDIGGLNGRTLPTVYVVHACHWVCSWCQSHNPAVWQPVGCRSQRGK